MSSGCTERFRLYRLPRETLSQTRKEEAKKKRTETAKAATTKWGEGKLPTGKEEWS